MFGEAFNNEIKLKELEARENGYQKRSRRDYGKNKEGRNHNAF